MASENVAQPVGLKPFEIVVVDDSPEDIRLIRDAFSLWKGSRHLNVFLNGAQVLDHLQTHAGDGVPDLILLDWNLPGIKGEQVLEYAKNDDNLRKVPVVIFTSSSAPTDKRRATELGAARFITKPLDIDEFFHAIASLESFADGHGHDGVR